MENRWHRTSHAGWSAWIWAGEHLRLVVVPEVGGRLLSLHAFGHEVLFGPLGPTGSVYRVTEDAATAAAKLVHGFRLWGGDKTWVAPQRGVHGWVADIPPLALDSGRYLPRFSGDEVTMTSALCPETGLVVERSIAPCGPSTFLTQEVFQNPGRQPVERGIWNVTQLRRPWTFRFDLADDDHRFRPYPEEGDSVAVFSKVTSSSAGTAEVQCLGPSHFKVGARLARGWVEGRHRLHDGSTLIMERRFHVTSGVYAHDAHVEIYNSADHGYCELEVHAPFLAVPPGGCTMLEQRWSFRHEPSPEGHHPG